MPVNEDTLKANEKNPCHLLTIVSDDLPTLNQIRGKAKYIAPMLNNIKEHDLSRLQQKIHSTFPLELSNQASFISTLNRGLVLKDQLSSMIKGTRSVVNTFLSTIDQNTLNEYHYLIDELSEQDIKLLVRNIHFECNNNAHYLASIKQKLEICQHSHQSKSPLLHALEFDYATDDTIIENSAQSSHSALSFLNMFSHRQRSTNPTGEHKHKGLGRLLSRFKNNSSSDKERLIKEDSACIEENPTFNILK